MKHKRTNTTTIILAALGGLFVYCLYKRKQKRAGVGDLSRYGMEGQKNMQDVFDVVESGQQGAFNDEITLDGETITVSTDVKEGAGVPYEITTKRDLRKAISWLRKQDKAIVFRAEAVDDLAYMSTAKRKQRVRAELPHADEGEARTSDDGYLQTLFYLMEGGKFCWSSTSTSRGVKDEILATRGNGKADRKAKAQILNDKRGITPEAFAERITAYGEDDAEVKKGVLQAITEVNTPTQALEILEYMVQQAAEAELPF